MRLVPPVLLIAIVAASCSDGVVTPTSLDTTGTAPVRTAAPSTTPATTIPPTAGPATTVPPSTSPAIDVPEPLADYMVGTVRVGGEELSVAIAVTFLERAQGLMGIEDLGSLDGMVFVWEEAETTSSFWMRDTLIPLDIAWFDSNGALVSTLTMPVCPPEEPCPTYAADGPYRYALEVPEGEMPPLDASSLLELVEGF